MPCQGAFARPQSIYCRINVARAASMRGAIVRLSIEYLRPLPAFSPAPPSTTHFPTFFPLQYLPGSRSCCNRPLKAMYRPFHSFAAPRRMVQHRASCATQCKLAGVWNVWGPSALCRATLCELALLAAAASDLEHSLRQPRADCKARSKLAGCDFLRRTHYGENCKNGLTVNAHEHRMHPEEVL